MGAKSDQVKGRVKEAAGTLTGSAELEREGQLDQASGAVKEKVDDAADKVDDTVDMIRQKLRELDGRDRRDPSTN